MLVMSSRGRQLFVNTRKHFCKLGSVCACIFGSTRDPRQNIALLFLSSLFTQHTRICVCWAPPNFNRTLFFYRSTLVYCIWFVSTIYKIIARFECSYMGLCNSRKCVYRLSKERARSDVADALRTQKHMCSARVNTFTFSVSLAVLVHAINWVAESDYKAITTRKAILLGGSERTHFLGDAFPRISINEITFFVLLFVCI